MATSTSHAWTKEEHETKKPLDKAKEVGGQALDKAKEVGGQALEKAKDVGGQALEKAKDVGSQALGKAKEAAGAMGDMATQAASAVGQRADDLTATAGHKVKDLGQAINEKGPQDGMLGTASHAVANTIKGAGEYMEEAKLSGMAEDLTSLIKNHPIPAMLACIGIGFCIARMIKD